MTVSPYELAILLHESVIPDEIKDSIIKDLIPKMSRSDIDDLYSLLKLERAERKKIQSSLDNYLEEMKKDIKTGKNTNF